MNNKKDKTRDLLKLIRENSSDIENEGINLTGSELEEEKRKFKELVNERTIFNSFKLYPDDVNVVFTGEFIDLNGLKWEFILKEDEEIISVENLSLTDDALRIINKLSAYYEKWSDLWASKIAEY